MRYAMCPQQTQSVRFQLQVRRGGSGVVHTTLQTSVSTLLNVTVQYV